MDPILGVVLLGSSLSMLGFAFWWLSPDQRHKREMKAIPRRLVRDVKDGERVRITGRVEVVTTVTAPISQRLCAYFRLVVRERKQKSWSTVVDEEAGVDFVVRDESGAVVVVAENAFAVVENDFTASTYTLAGRLPQAMLHLEPFLEARGIAVNGVFLPNQFDVKEGVIEEGETVHVVGVARWEPDPTAEATSGASGFREPPKRLVIRPRDDQSTQITDHPLD